LAARVPLCVYRRAGDHGSFLEETCTLLVNAGGGLLPLSVKPALGETLLLVNLATREEQEFCVAYVGPQVSGKARVGLAFKQPMPSFWRIGRQDERIAKELRVWVRGTDRNGNPFVQSAQTIDVSRHGARLDGVGYLTGPDRIIEVRRGWRRARFRVVWTGQMGTAQANQIGVCCLEPNKYIWGKT